MALKTLPPADDKAQDGKPDAPMPIDLYKFALNAFLVPLLDDAVPPRWTDVAMEFACGPGTTVIVDGEPMVAGQPIPVKAFTVRWMMESCLPMGQESVELSGGVELVVHRKGAGLSAVVKPDIADRQPHGPRMAARPFYCGNRNGYARIDEAVKNCKTLIARYCTTAHPDKWQRTIKIWC